jgi:glycosyltransferase involved in cell wall biosynthesis
VRESTPSVSAVVPTRDRPELCAQAVRSALEQRIPRLEVIVVDDGSRDAGATRRAVLIDPRVRVVRLEASGGVAAARNRGIETATGDWIALLDDDDLWAPGKLAAQLELAAEAGLECVYTDFALVDLERRVIGVSRAPDPAEAKAMVRQRSPFHAGTCTVIARADRVRAVGGFDEQLRQLADWDLWLRLMPGVEIGRCPMVLAARTEDTENMTATTTRSLRDELRYLVDKHHLEGELDRAHFEAWITTWHRRSGRRRAASLGYLRQARERRSAQDAVRAVGVLVGERFMHAARRHGGMPRAEALAAPATWSELIAEEAHGPR